MAELYKMTVNIPFDLDKLLTRVAEADGVTKTAYVNRLIEQDLQDRREHYLALHEIFGDGSGEDKGGC